MKNTKKPTLFLHGIVALIITIVLVGVFLHYIDKEKLLKIVFTVKPWFLLAALGVFIGITAVRAARFALLKNNLPFLLMFRISAVHTALLRVMPFRSGEITIGILYKISGRGSFGEGIFAVVFVRILDAIIIAVMTCAGASTFFKAQGLSATWLFGFMLLALLLLVFFLLGSSMTFLQRFSPEKNTLFKTRFFQKVLALVRHVSQLPLRTKLLLLLLTIILWPLLVIWFYLIMLGIGVVLPFADMLMIGSLGIIGSIIPLSVLGSFGPLEGSFAIAFHHIGLAPETAIAYGIAISIWTFIASWLVAIPSLLLMLLRERIHKRAVASQ